MFEFLINSNVSDLCAKDFTDFRARVVWVICVQRRAYYKVQSWAEECHKKPGRCGLDRWHMQLIQVTFDKRVSY